MSVIEFPVNLQLEKPIGLCSDHAGYELKQFLIALFESKGIAYKDFGTNSTQSCDYADFAHLLADAVEKGDCYPGIGICGSGNGINITLNKHQAVRSALCWNAEIATLARAHNDANVLVMPARFIDQETALQIVANFLTTPFEGGRHCARVEKIPVKK